MFQHRQRISRIDLFSGESYEGRPPPCFWIQSLSGDVMSLQETALSQCLRSHVRRPVWRFLSFALSLLVFVCGCGGSEAVTEPETPVAHRSATSFDTPLDEEEIRTFLEIVRALPEGRSPEFAPLPRSAVDDRLPSETLVTAYRQEYRRMFDPVEQGSRWRRDRELMAILTSRGIEPEEFASLMTRLGCAVAAGTVSSRLNLTAASAKSDRQLQAIISRIDKWDNAAASGAATPLDVSQRRQPLVDQLKDLVALSEFSRLLLSIPEESRVMIARHKQELAVHLPQADSLRLFERTLDTDAVIVPVNFEQPQRSSTPK